MYVCTQLSNFHCNRRGCAELSHDLGQSDQNEPTFHVPLTSEGPDNLCIRQMPCQMDIINVSSCTKTPKALHVAHAEIKLQKKNCMSRTLWSASVAGTPRIALKDRSKHIEQPCPECISPTHSKETVHTPINSWRWEDPYRNILFYPVDCFDSLPKLFELHCTS